MKNQGQHFPTAEMQSCAIQKSVVCERFQSSVVLYTEETFEPPAEQYHAQHVPNACALKTNTCSIKTQQAKMANALIKRVASDRGTTTKGAVAAGPRPRQNEPTSNAMNSNASAQSIKNDDPSRPVTASLHVQGPLERQVPGKGANWGDDGGTRPPFSGRRPWRAGGISPFKCEDKKCAT